MWWLTKRIKDKKEIPIEREFIKCCVCKAMFEREDIYIVDYVPYCCKCKPKYETSIMVRKYNKQGVFKGASKMKYFKRIKADTSYEVTKDGKPVKNWYKDLLK